jgi:hypothetical protein
MGASVHEAEGQSLGNLSAMEHNMLKYGECDSCFANQLPCTANANDNLSLI